MEEFSTAERSLFLRYPATTMEKEKAGNQARYRHQTRVADPDP
jgi:hypothetical protein